MNWKVTIITFCAPMALLFIYSSFALISGAMKMEDSEKQSSRIIGALVILFIGLAFLAFTFGAIFS